MPTISSGDVTSLLSALSTAMTGLVGFLVDGAGLWITLAVALMVVGLLRRFLGLRKA